MNQLRLDGSLLSTLLHSVTLPVPSSTCSDQRTWRSPPTASMQHVSGCDAPIHGVSLGCRRRDNATSATSRPRRWVPQQHIVHILDVSEYKCVPIVISCCVDIRPTLITTIATCINHITYGGHSHNHNVSVKVPGRRVVGTNEEPVIYRLGGCRKQSPQKELVTSETSV
jgi:hypothetical protein